MCTGRRKSRAGLSLIEVVISTMLVGLVLVGAMQCLGAVIRGRMHTSESGRAQQLAQQLMAEILATEYQEPVEPPVFGPEESESEGSRKYFDDVDDYHRWTATPPQDRNGTALHNRTGWKREVTVEYVNPTNPGTLEATDLGVKRITVTIRLDGNLLSQQVALRSDRYTIP
jgi:Tfp pilus assembly protein PilV